MPAIARARAAPLPRHRPRSAFRSALPPRLAVPDWCSCSSPVIFTHVKYLEMRHMSKNTKSERTRGEILDAAWTLIAERGASVSLGEVAAAAGITRQSVYVHFG
ncbi:TetR family transcriptional regulator, partial [Parvibaculum sp.]|uniref:TetR family transcriptional regulator n=1 Tax=Parvibaculum sp. TaxID=2024848 RepID=UPI0034492C6D